MNAQTAWRIQNLEFKIAFSETNLRWIAGEPDPYSVENKRAKEINLAGIREAKAELEQLTTQETSK